MTHTFLFAQNQTHQSNYRSSKQKGDCSICSYNNCVIEKEAQI
jgi:hypothetical protein